MKKIRAIPTDFWKRMEYYENETIDGNLDLSEEESEKLIVDLMLKHYESEYKRLLKIAPTVIRFILPEIKQRLNYLEHAK